MINHAHDVYEFEKQLGRGSFGKVYQALHKPTNELVAVKVRSSSAIYSMINNMCAPVLLLMNRCCVAAEVAPKRKR